MHFEILIEDQSGKAFLEEIISKLVANNDTVTVHAYKGIGRIPKDLAGKPDPTKRILLSLLPKLLSGYGKTFSGYPKDYKACVFVVCDLDDKCLKEFKGQLLKILQACDPEPTAQFCFAIEEGEAWLLGDPGAIRAAYPKVKEAILASYKNDAVCGTWEVLADAVFPGGSKDLIAKGWRAVGEEKSIWAKNITKHMDPENNKSPSFCYFRDVLKTIGGNKK